MPTLTRSPTALRNHRRCGCYSRRRQIGVGCFAKATNRTRNGRGQQSPRLIEFLTQYRYLLDWYDSKFAPKKQERWLQGAFDMIGVGRDVFRGIDIDEYVRDLRGGWD